MQNSSSYGAVESSDSSGISPEELESLNFDDVFLGLVDGASSSFYGQPRL